MELKTLNTVLPVVEFQHYITNVSANSDVKLRSVLDLVFDEIVTLEDFSSTNFTSIFTVEADTQTHLFSDYELAEYYIDPENGNCVKATFVK
jgi:hypothetical protein